MGALLAIALAAAPSEAPAQGKPPPRPRLPPGADTNSAAAYHGFGLQRLRTGQSRQTQAHHAEQAADAFYWASRLAPDWAAPLYARRVAVLLSRPEWMVPYMEGVKSVVQSKEARQLDSLRLRALLLDPFLYEDLDHELVMRYVTERTMTNIQRRYPGYDLESLRPEVESEVMRYLQSPRAVEWRAWLAYGDRRFAEAVTFYAEMLKSTGDKKPVVKSRLHAQRGRAFYLSGRMDSAQTELAAAIAELRRRDEKETIPVYESKALLEHSLGVALEAARDIAGAREAYGRALVEDLAFYPAHVRLGGLLAATGDTAGASREYELAVEVAPEAAVPRVLLANHYNATGNYAAAVKTSEPLLEREPYWAEVHLVRGVAFEGLGNRETAVEHYKSFLARLMAGDDRRAWVTQRLAALAQP